MSEKLYYTWKAHFSNRSPILQYENEKEILFREVLEEEDELTSFELISEKGDSYLIALFSGKFYMNGKIIKEVDFEGHKPELIYFRRVKVFVNFYNITEFMPDITYFLGVRCGKKLIALEISEKGYKWRNYI